MIIRKDLMAIDQNYFDVLAATSFYVVLRSKNTGHYWHILEQHPNKHLSYFISHKHHASDPYHPQAHRPTLARCCQYIRDHDAFHQKRERTKHNNRSRS